MGKQKKRFFPVTFSVDDKTLEGLDALAAHQDRNRSQVLRVLVKQAVERLKRKVR